MVHCWFGLVIFGISQLPNPKTDAFEKSHRPQRGLHRLCPQAKLNSTGRATFRSWHGQQERFVEEAPGETGTRKPQDAQIQNRKNKNKHKGTSCHVICRIELLLCYLHLGDSDEKYL